MATKSVAKQKNEARKALKQVLGPGFNYGTVDWFIGSLRELGYKVVPLDVTYEGDPPCDKV